jgi:hypothetical protein
MPDLKTRILNMKDYKGKLISLMNQRLRAVEANDLDHNLPLFVWGAPAIGKSQILMSVCRETWLNAKTKNDKSVWTAAEVKTLNTLRPWDSSQWPWFTKTDVELLRKNMQGWLLMDVRLSMCDSIELKGAPFYNIAEQKAGFIRFSSILPDPKGEWPVFLFLDELPLAADLIQSAAYQLINDRRAGDYRLPENCVVLAAGNQEKFGGVHFSMSPALESRFDHITLDIDIDGFLKYIGKQGYDDTMTAYLQYAKTEDKEAIYKLSAGEGNFPTFRSWEKAMRKVRYGEKEYDACADSVGIAVATKFELFKEQTRDIPDASVLVEKKLYYEDVALQLVASQKVGAQLLNPEHLAALKTPERAFEFLRYFIDMKNPKDKSDSREELTVLFLLNLKDELVTLEYLNKGYESALRAGTMKVEKDKDGKKIDELFTYIFWKWDSLSESM